MATVILGAGIIGVSTAFYLSESEHIDPSTIHLVEATPSLFSSASGYAGGFLAEDWFSANAAPLGALSFAEHKQLAEKYGGKVKWGYSLSTGTTYAPARARRKNPKSKGNDVLNGHGANSDEQSEELGMERDPEKVDVWCREGTSRVDAAPEGVSTFVGKDIDPRAPGWLTRTVGDKLDFVSEEGSTAQVDPLKLCQFLASECERRGVQIHKPVNATSISTDDNGALRAIHVTNTESGDQTEIPCNRLLISAGAWSPQVFKALFPNSNAKIPISSLAGHSLVVNSPRWQMDHEKMGCHAVFTTDEQGFSPEIFSRIGGEIYVAGANSITLPLPQRADKVEIDDMVVAQLQKTAKRLLGKPGMEDLKEVRKGLCFRPVTDWGTPILDRIEDAKLGSAKTGGVWLAAGHGPWGISMSLGTGKVMAEMMTGRQTSVDVSGLGFR